MFFHIYCVISFNWPLDKFISLRLFASFFFWQLFSHSPWGPWDSWVALGLLGGWEGSISELPIGWHRKGAQSGWPGLTGLTWLGEGRRSKVSWKHLERNSHESMGDLQDPKMEVRYCTIWGHILGRYWMEMAIEWNFMKKTQALMFLASSSSACWWVARPLRRFISSTRLGPGQLGSWAVGTDSLETHRLRWHPKYARDINIEWYWHSKDVPNWDVARNSLIITDFGTALKYVLCQQCQQPLFALEFCTWLSYQKHLAPGTVRWPWRTIPRIASG